MFPSSYYCATTKTMLFRCQRAVATGSTSRLLLRPLISLQVNRNGSPFALCSVRNHSDLIFKNNNYREEVRQAMDNAMQMDMATDEMKQRPIFHPSSNLPHQQTLSSTTPPTVVVDDDFDVFDDDPNIAEYEARIHNQIPTVILDEEKNNNKVDPSKAFKDVDDDKDGLISLEQFKNALQELQYNEMKETQTTIHKFMDQQRNRLEKKLDLILYIEEQLLELTETCEAKEDVYYNNVGMTTASDIDVLFAKSALRRKDIQKSINELKGLVEEAKIIHSQSYWENDL